jgi:hypothetical protein
MADDPSHPILPRSPDHGRVKAQRLAIRLRRLPIVARLRMERNRLAMVSLKLPKIQTLHQPAGLKSVPGQPGGEGFLSLPPSP